MLLLDELHVSGRHKYQSNEYIQELGLNWMDFHARQYDPQIGRFLGIDPLADAYGQQIFSTYSAMGNAPTHMIDPNGESFSDSKHQLQGAGKDVGSVMTDDELLSQALMQGRLDNWREGFSGSGGPGGSSGLGYLGSYRSTLDFVNGFGGETRARNYVVNYNSAVQRTQKGQIAKARKIQKSIDNSYLYASLGGEMHTNDGGDPDPQQGGRRKTLHQIMAEDLKGTHGEALVYICQFFAANKGLTKYQIINQRDDQSLTPLNSQNGGPFLRYLQDPVNPNAVIDLRHMLVVGQLDMFSANAIEHAQSMAVWNKGIQESAGQFQDYYSNDLGRRFYGVYGSQIQQNPSQFSQYLFNFLTDKNIPRLNYHGGYDYYNKK